MWSNILNNARPISAYTTLNNKTSKIKNNNKEIDLDFQNKKKKLKHTEIECYNQNNKKNSNFKKPVKKKYSEFALCQHILLEIIHLFILFPKLLMIIINKI